jgi:hypothetical protein
VSDCLARNCRIFCPSLVRVRHREEPGRATWRSRSRYGWCRRAEGPATAGRSFRPMASGSPRRYAPRDDGWPFRHREEPEGRRGDPGPLPRCERCRKGVAASTRISQMLRHGARVRALGGEPFRETKVGSVTKSGAGPEPLGAANRRHRHRSETHRNCASREGVDRGRRDALSARLGNDRQVVQIEAVGPLGSASRKASSAGASPSDQGWLKRRPAKRPQGVRARQPGEYSRCFSAILRGARQARRGSPRRSGKPRRGGPRSMGAKERFG